MDLPLISILELNPKEMSAVLQALLFMSRQDTDLDLAHRAASLLHRIEYKLAKQREDTQE